MARVGDEVQRHPSLLRPHLLLLLRLKGQPQGVLLHAPDAPYSQLLRGGAVATGPQGAQLSTANRCQGAGQGQHSDGWRRKARRGVPAPYGRASAHLQQLRPGGVVGRQRDQPAEPVLQYAQLQDGQGGGQGGRNTSVHATELVADMCGIHQIEYTAEWGAERGRTRV